MLAFVVSATNRIAGLGYTVGSEFESAVQQFGDPGADIDSRWKRDDSVSMPRNLASALSLLLDTRYGRFGLLLLILYTFQVVAGLIAVSRRKVGALLACRMGLVGLLGIRAEIIRARYLSAWGITSLVGTAVSIMFTLVVILMFRASDAQGSDTTVT